MKIYANTLVYTACVCGCQPYGQRLCKFICKLIILLIHCNDTSVNIFNHENFLSYGINQKHLSIKNQPHQLLPLCRSITG